MIHNAERTVAISSLGWVDGDALWRFDVPAARVERISLASGARYLSLHAIGGESFAVGHHFDGARFEVTVRRLSDPAHVLARATVSAGRTAVDGSAQAWVGVPRLYIAYLAFEPWNDFVLLLIIGAAGRVEVQRLEWYDGAYDKMYQGVVDVLEIPGENAALVSVQRSSRLILHDLGTGRMKRAVELAGRQGNPTLRWRNAAPEIWASDYDTIVVIDRRDWRPLRSARLQDRGPRGARQFIGEYSFGPDDDACVVARPFSGDVVSLDPSTLSIRRRAPVGRQPLEAALLPGGAVVARDWKTGDLLRGTLRRRRFGL
jgi:hypothetical protein